MNFQVWEFGELRGGDAGWEKEDELGTLWPKVGFPSASLPCEEEGEGGLVGRDDAGWAASEPERGKR